MAQKQVPQSLPRGLHLSLRKQALDSRTVKRFASAKEAVLFKMQELYGHSGFVIVAKEIEGYFFPNLIEGAERYLEIHSRKTQGLTVSESEKVYISQGFMEHMRNWCCALVTNYRGENQEPMQKSFQFFYTKLLEELKRQSEEGGKRFLPEA